MELEQIVEATVKYPARQGFIMLAHKIQHFLALQTSKPVRIEEQPDNRFQIYINGATVYDCLPQRSAEVDQTEIIKILSRYKLSESTETIVVKDSGDSNDPDHLQWMNCVCSGE